MVSKSQFLGENGNRRKLFSGLFLPSFAAWEIRRNLTNSYLGDVELIAKFEDELGHEKASGLSDLSSSVKNIEDVLARASWDVRGKQDDLMHNRTC